MNKHKVGDIVRLNSGSPDLLVAAVSGDEITVEWLNEGRRETYTAPSVCFYSTGMNMFSIPLDQVQDLESRKL